MPDWMSSSDGYTRATCYSCAYDRKELFPLLFHYRAVQFTHASSRRLYWPRPKARLAVASNVSPTIIQVHGRKNRQVPASVTVGCLSHVSPPALSRCSCVSRTTGQGRFHGLR
jgi:hypothetical protein